MSGEILFDMEQCDVPGFAYGDLPADIATKARDAAAEINRITSANVREIGNILIDAKALLPHGKFAEWTDKELRITSRTAQNYMAAARFLEGKSETLSHLPAAIVYALAAPSAPEKVVAEVIEAATRGALPPAETINHQIDMAVEEKRAIKRLMTKKSVKSEGEARKRLQKDREQRRLDMERHQAEREERKRQEEQAAFTVSELVSMYPKVMWEVLQVIDADPHGFARYLRNALSTDAQEAGR